MGWVASTGDLAIAAIVIGTLGVIVTANYPVGLFWLVLAGALVISGVVSLYLPQFQYIRWGVSLASLAIAVLALFRDWSVGKHRFGSATPLLLSMCALFVLVLVSGLANSMSPAALAIGMKSYFQVAGIFMAFVLCRWPDKFIDSIPKAIFWFAILQLPFALHQYFVLVPMRADIGGGIVAIDIVAGTFGASEFGGGANAVLSAFWFRWWQY